MSLARAVRTERICGLIECLPCSVWAWCDLPVYHPPPECPEETIAGSSWARTPEERARDLAHPDIAGFLRGLDDDMPLSRYWRRRRAEAQRRYVKWWHQQRHGHGRPSRPGFAIISDAGVAARAKATFAATLDEKGGAQ